MSIEAALREESDRADHREMATFAVLPYVLLTVSTLIALAQPALAVPIPAVLGITAAAALWMAWFVSFRPRGNERGPLKGVYYAGLTVLIAALVALAPFYGIFAFIGYVHAVEFLDGRWRYLGAATTSMVMAVAYMGGAASISADDEWWLWVVISLFSSVIAGVFMHIIHNSFQHGREQRDALTRLHETNAKLEAALQENAELHTRLVVQAREAGVQDERQRIARDLHDTLAQGLAGILAQLQAAEQTLDQPSPALRHVRTAKDLARESLIEARHTIHAVRPQALAEARLPEAINDMTTRWSQVNGIEATLTTTGAPRPMHTDIESALLRMAQEALTNVAKHARAGRVHLTLSYMEGLVTLDARDDGVGFTIGTAHAEGGFGLAGMRQRIQRLSGRLDIESEPGGGTTICASVPAIPAQEGA